jgi:hypothetical protein
MSGFEMIVLNFRIKGVVSHLRTINEVKHDVGLKFQKPVSIDEKFFFQKTLKGLSLWSSSL